MATDSWPDTAPVTRSWSSWASSTTTTSYSGRTARPSKALTASMAWLVTTTSASAASCRASSLKHSAAMGHFCAPRHSIEVTETWRQARSVTPGRSSSRSPWPFFPPIRAAGPLPCPAGRTVRPVRRRSAARWCPRPGKTAALRKVPPTGIRPRACAGTRSWSGPDQRDLDGAVQGGRDGFQQPRQGPCPRSASAGRGGGGNQGGLVAHERMGDQRNQVRQRLSGAGAGLDQQVVAGFDGPGHLPGHLMLAAAALPAHPATARSSSSMTNCSPTRTRGLTWPWFSHC